MTSTGIDNSGKFCFVDANIEFFNLFSSKPLEIVKFSKFKFREVTHAKFTPAKTY